MALGLAAWLVGTGRRRDLGLQIAMIGPAWIAYFLVRGVTEGDVATAVEHSRALANFERATEIHFGPWMNDLITRSDSLTTVANLVYIWGHWPLIFVVAIWLFWHHPDTFLRCERAFLVSGAIGLTFFFFLPTAPPRLAGGDFVDTVTTYSQSYRLLQPALLTNQYAAFPSLHVGWNLLIGLAIVCTARGRWFRLFGALSPVAMGLAAVATANHYVIDIIAGVIVAMIGLAIVAVGEDHFGGRRSDSGDAPPGSRTSGRWRALARLTY